MEQTGKILEATKCRLRAVVMREFAKAMLRAAKSEEQLAEALELPPLRVEVAHG
jgi:hypothetical protein